MTKREKHQLLAKRLRTAAQHYKKSMSTMFRFDEDMVNEIENDYWDLRCIASSIREGDVELAANAARRLDTAVRDEIPASVWEYLSEHMR